MISVGVGISTYKSSERVAELVDSIDQTTEDDPVEIFVIDDGSDEQTKKDLTSLAHAYQFTLGFHGTNQGISATWNHLIHKIGIEWNCDVAVILNDDVVLTPGWLDAVRYFFEHNENVGIVGFNALYDGAPMRPRENPDVDVTAPLAVVSATGFAYAVRPNVIKQVEWFDEVFKSFYEEVDMGIRVAKAGYVNYDIPWPVLNHQWSACFSENPELKADLRMRISKKNFERKHGPLTKQDALRDRLKLPEKVKYLYDGKECEIAGNDVPRLIWLECITKESAKVTPRRLRWFASTTRADPG